MANQRKSVEHTAEENPPTAHSSDEATADTCLQSSDPGSLSAITPGGRLRSNDILTGRFRIIRFIAAGGMGEVYEVEDQRLQGVRLALKTILPHVAARPDTQERFEREVLLARRVTHPNLCPIYDIFHCRHQDEDLIFLTMKLLPGETLSARIDRDGPIPLDEAGHIVEQVAAALSAAHEAGILHRDIKTANIMLDGSGPTVRACVTDFGLARAYQSETTILTADGIAGTPGYLAPELFNGEPPSTATDVYAFGVVVYKMLSGHAPPFRPNTRDVFMDELPANWRRFIESCLRPSPLERWKDLSEAVETLRGGNRGSQPRAASVSKISRRHILALGAGTAAAAAAGGVWLNWPRINFALHPLPAKRFVALVSWPTPSDARIAPMITAAVDAIASELARAEAFDHDLLIIPHSVGKDTTTFAQLNELRESLGANLVLAVSGVPDVNQLQLFLRVLDPASSRTIREMPFKVPVDERFLIPERAVQIAAQLLGVTRYEPDADRVKAGTSSHEAYEAFQTAQTLIRQPNDNGLQAAIDKYKEAVEIDTHYALANAELAWAYCRLYLLHKDVAALSLAEANATAALKGDPQLVEGHLAFASVREYRGDKESALRETGKALALDPSNPKTLVYQAQLYSRLDKWAEAKATFERVIDARPNYWLAHHELGVLYNAEGQYAEALNQFKAVTLEKPKDVLAFNNVGSVYLQMGNVDEAMNYLEKSMALKQNYYAAITMAAALRIQGKYAAAVETSKIAVSIEESSVYSWLALADSYALLPGHQTDAKAAYSKCATLAAEQLQTDPSDGPLTVIQALARVKVGEPASAVSLLEKSQDRHADDIDSQLLKVRILEQLGKRDDALLAVARCLSRGATLFQIQTMQDIGPLLKDPRFQSLAASNAYGNITNH